jgi:hypothetical protein
MTLFSLKATIGGNWKNDQGKLNWGMNHEFSLPAGPILLSQRFSFQPENDFMISIHSFLLNGPFNTLAEIETKREKNLVSQTFKLDSKLLATKTKKTNLSDAKTQTLNFNAELSGRGIWKSSDFNTELWQSNYLEALKSSFLNYFLPIEREKSNSREFILNMKTGLSGAHTGLHIIGSAESIYISSQALSRQTYRAGVNVPITVKKERGEISLHKVFSTESNRENTGFIEDMLSFSDFLKSSLPLWQIYPFSH